MAHTFFDEALEIIVEVICVCSVFLVSTAVINRGRRSKSKSMHNRIGEKDCSEGTNVHDKADYWSFGGCSSGKASNHSVAQRAHGGPFGQKALPPKGASFSPSLAQMSCSNGAQQEWVGAAGHDCQWRERTAPNCLLNWKAVPRLGQYVAVNKLDRNCALLLRRLAAPQVEWIIDQEFFVDVDPSRGTSSSKVVGYVVRSRQKSQTFWEEYPAPQDVAKRRAEFVMINALDERCQKTLERLPEALLRQVMDHEFVVQVDQAKGTASAKVIGRVMKLKQSSVAGL